MPRKRRQANVLPVLGILLLSIPVYLLARWIRISIAVDSHEAAVAEFGSTLPHVLQDPLASTSFAFGCAAAGAAVGALALVRLSEWGRWLGVAILAVGALLASWFAWGLL
ncbi:MAG: hypothetical protein OXN89_19555 [Bryobacterales bacterium]|nr:hypothetical protein [Bryobacterales bacterium]